ncbi:MAG TPA: DUF2256 domain-containing protein [Pseudoxanthomonas sp.]|nr:DUF2256 domain-containing protein [Pseudoxanthomonas sp.]
MKKQQQPTKTCPVCQRDFAWRKKWQRDWDSVKFCSDACRRGTPRMGVGTAAARRKH